MIGYTARLVKWVGLLLAIVLSIIATPIGIAWDICANPEARRTRRGRGGFPVTLRIHEDTWYGRLYRRAYGADRGWIVFLRRLCLATGFQYASPPRTRPQHEHGAEPPAGSNDVCVTCAAFDIALAAYPRERQEAYERHCAALHASPDEQPFNPTGRPISRCPFFYKVVLACFVYVCGVAFRRQAIAFLGLVLFGGAQGLAYTYRFVRQRYGRAIALGVTGGAMLVGLYVTVGLAHAAYGWHAVRAAYEEQLAAAEAVAVVEKDAHTAWRPIAEDRIEAGLVLAVVTRIQLDLREVVDRRLRENAHHVQVIESGGYLRYQRSYIDALYTTADVLSVELLSDLEDGDAGCGSDWWHRPRNSLWQFNVWEPLEGAYSDLEQQEAACLRVLDAIAALIAWDVEVAEALFVPYREYQHRMQRAYDAPFIAAVLARAQEYVGNPLMLHEWFTDVCAQSSGDAPWAVQCCRSSCPCRTVCVPMQVAGVRETVCDFPPSACAAVSGLFATQLAKGQEIANTGSYDAQVERETREADERARVALAAEFDQELTAALVAAPDSCALLRAMRQYCEYDTASGQWLVSHGGPEDVRTPICARAGVEHASTLAFVQAYEWVRDVWQHYGVPTVSVVVCLVSLVVLAALLTFMVGVLHTSGALRWLGRALHTVAAACWRNPIVAFVRSVCAVVLRSIGLVMDSLFHGCAWAVVETCKFAWAVVCGTCRGIRDGARFIVGFVGDVKRDACQLIEWESTHN